ncbi:MAG TPA: hypothetical protein VHJ17_15575 [Thermomonospora sp.]|nr:hypothetical protein [Thermomonospora sp.]
MTGDWRVLVRDQDRRLIGEVGAEHTLEIVDRHLAVGSWSITVDAGSRDARLLRDGHGIVFLRDGAIAFSGPTRLVERVHNADEGGYGTLTASGTCDLAWLSRLVYPEATTTDLGATARTFAVTSYRLGPAKAETVLRTLADKHAGPGAATARQVPGLVLAPVDQQQGADVTVSARFDSLLETMLDTAARGRVGFDVRQRLDGRLELSVYPERDRRAHARFSIELGNLRSYQYTINPPEATFVVVADEGENTARRYWGFGRPDPLWPGLRIEDFLDGADLEGDAQAKAQAAATARLDETRGMASVTFEPIDTEAVVLGRDYRKGDTVTVEVDGLPYSDVVREIRYTRTADEGQVIMPVVGQDEESPRIYRRLARLQRRVHSLETRR